MINEELDPFSVTLAELSAIGDSDLFMQATSGLPYEVSLSPQENYSHTTRIRALIPRAKLSYNSLSREARLAAANSAIGWVARSPNETDRIQTLSASLGKIGWSVQDGTLVAVDAKLREIFFPAGSPWDAHVAIRDIMAKSASSITIVDPYCDDTIFSLIPHPRINALKVQILCGNKPGQNAKLKAEAGKFTAQFKEILIELRSTTTFHDRFLVIDDTDCHHLGASLNRAGFRAFMLSLVETPAVSGLLLRTVQDAWNSAVPV